MKNFLLVLCLLSFSMVCFAFDLDKWNEYSKLRYSECSAGDTNCINRVHNELIKELDAYERNINIMMNQHNFNMLQEQINSPRKIKYGYNSNGDYVPLEF